MEQEIWVVAEGAHPELGSEVVEADLIAHGDEKGVVVIDGAEVFVQKCSRSGVDAIIDRARGSARDPRVIAPRPTGEETVPFREAVGLLSEWTPPGWKLQGPRAVREWLRAVRDGPGDLVLYHSEWVRRSGVHDGRAVAHIHLVICEVLRVSLQCDRLDVSSIQGYEIMVRRLIQDETAVARNPRHPDYGGLEVLMSSPLTESGMASVPAFNEWITGRLREQANIQKQTRLWHEEQRLRSAYGEENTGGSRGAGTHETKCSGKGKQSSSGKKKRGAEGAEAGAA